MNYIGFVDTSEVINAFTEKQNELHDYKKAGAELAAAGKVLLENIVSNDEHIDINNDIRQDVADFATALLSYQHMVATKYSDYEEMD